MSEMVGPGKPLPLPDETSRAYWEGAREHELRILRCEDCQWFIHYPEPACPRCQSSRVVPVRVSGRGLVYSYTVTHHKGAPGFQNDVPFVVALVELEEQAGLRIIANIRGYTPADVRIGMPVEVIFEDAGSGITLPQFSVRSTRPSSS
jgi:uncharacterized OB-fold protein